MRHSRLVLRTLLLFLALSAPTASLLRAQAAAPIRNVPVMIRDYSERRFGTADGLRSLSVFAVEAFPDGSLWLGTDAGAYRFESGRFENVPLPGGPRHVRNIAMMDDGSLWFGTRMGIVRRTAAGDTRLFSAPDGVPSGTVYSLLNTDAVDGVRRLTAATASGLTQFDGTVWHELPVPGGVKMTGPVLRARSRPGRSDELWLATLDGAIAVWRDGAWQRIFRAAGGEALGPLEQLQVLDDSSRTLYAAGRDGVMRLVERDDGERWEMLPGSPTSAYRLASVPDSLGGQELWVGTLNGLLLRYRQARWDTIVLRTTEPRSQIRALTGVRHAGGYAVYVGTFGDGVVRLSLGRAAALVSDEASLRLSIRTVLEAPLGRSGPIWIVTKDFGVIAVENGRANTIVSARDGIRGQLLHLWVRPPRQATSSVWLGTTLGAWERVRDRWRPRAQGLGETAVSRFALEREADTTAALVAATDSGAMRWDGEVWRRLEGSPVSPILDVLGEGAEDRVLWLTGADGVWRRERGQWYVDPRPTVDGAPLSLSRLCRIGSGPNARLLGAGASGVFYRDMRDGSWRLLPDRVHRFFGLEQAHDLRCDDPTSVLVGTDGGIAALDLSAADTAAWRMRTMLGPADGLPSPVVYAIGEGGAPGSRWIGTAHGVGRINVRALPALPADMFTMRILSGANRTIVPDGGSVAAKDNRIVLRMLLPTFHREEDLRYRVSIRGPLTASSDEWVSTREITYPALQPGRYSVSVWARDHAGREYGPISQRFSVDHPPFQSPTWLLLYASLVVGAIVFLYRWRLGLLNERTAVLQESERRARASEHQFRALFEGAFDANFVERDGVVRTANAAAVQLFGQPMAALVGQRVDALGFANLPPSDPVGMSAADSEVVRADGRRVPVTLTITEIEREQRHVRHWVVRDLSAAKNAEEQRRVLESQIREAQKLESLGTLAGGVAHDFNNLLGVIRGNTELARDALDDPDQVADHLAAVLDASERARDLVRQILTFSRRTSPHESLLDLAAVVRALLPMLRSLIPRSVELTVLGGDGMYPIRGDVTQLQQLLFNLCSNAEYAMRPTNGGVLELSLVTTTRPREMGEGTASVVRLRVRDTGVGMSAEVRDRVFEPFYTTKPTGEGTGLGLSVLHGVVASHHGHVLLQSDEGQGTTFDVYFPLVPEGAATLLGTPTVNVPVSAADAARAVASDQETLTGARIVLVDDEPLVARVTERALTRVGCVVRVFSDPATALAAVRAAPSETDLVLTDQTMPGMTGDVLAEAISALGVPLPVVIVTGHSYRLTPDRLMAVGAAAVLQKPVPLAVLTRTVAAVLRGESILDGNE